MLDAVKSCSGRSKRRGADTRQVTATPHNRYDALPAPAAPGPRADAVAYAGSKTTFVLTGVRK
jgi:hypothetical protein